MTDDLMRTFAELNPVADPDRLLTLEAPELPADPLLRTVLERRTIPGPKGGVRRAHRRPRTLVAVGVAVAVVLAAVVGVPLLSPSDRPSVVAHGGVSGEAAELLTGFLEARIAGEPVRQYLDDDSQSAIPLLYATSSGDRYDRAEYEPVEGSGWPYGFAAYEVRLYASDTVVEQLFFMPHDDPERFAPDGRPRLEYQPDGFGTHIPPTTENGQPLAMRYSYFAGHVTVYAAHPWVPQNGSPRLIPGGSDVPPTTDGGQRHHWDDLHLMADPVWAGTRCRARPAPADAETLAERISSDPDVEATAPVAVEAGGVGGVMVDVDIAAGARICTAADPMGNIIGETDLASLVFDEAGRAQVRDGTARGRATGERVRLYLFDAPEGSSMRILAVAVVAPASRFARTVEEAAPVVDSLEFHIP